MKNTMKTKCLHCDKDISVTELLAEAKVLNEEAILTCPVCGTEMELTAVLKSMPGENDDFAADDGPGGPDDMGGGSDGGGIFDDLEDGDAEPGGMLDGEADDDVEFQEIEDEEDEDEEDEDEVEESKLRVYACESCKRNWLSDSKVPCPECHDENVVLTDKSISEALARVLREVNTGVPVSRAVSKLFPELAEAI
jgi:RNA polymerase subunit RPABC4/transcription elongation factor Spt4